MNDQRRQFILGFIAYVVQRGIDARELCEEAGVNLEIITQDTETDISEATLHRLWLAASKLTKDPLFGLHFGESFQLPALGAVGEIIKSSETVGKALTIAASLTPVVTTMYDMQVGKDNRTITIRFVSTRDEPLIIAQQVADFLMVFTIHELTGLLLKRISPEAITYPFSMSTADEYKRVLRCTRIAKGDELVIAFNASYWNEPIITANYEMQQFFLEKIAPRQPGSAISFQTRVLDFLLKNSLHGIPTLDDVAANFNITNRSLQRRLQSEGTTFQQTADNVRKTLALHYLESGNYKIKEISNLLGYNELSAFSRAFKRWTGKAPLGYSA